MLTAFCDWLNKDLDRKEMIGHFLAEQVSENIYFLIYIPKFTRSTLATTHGFETEENNRVFLNHRQQKRNVQLWLEKCKTSSQKHNCFLQSTRLDPNESNIWSKIFANSIFAHTHNKPCWHLVQLAKTCTQHREGTLLCHGAAQW